MSRHTRSELLLPRTIWRLKSSSAMSANDCHVTPSGSDKSAVLGRSAGYEVVGSRSTTHYVGDVGMFATSARTYSSVSEFIERRCKWDKAHRPGWSGRFYPPRWHACTRR